MSHLPVLQLLDDYVAEILRRQDESWQSPSPEAFHQLRVFIKRMRALLGLVEQISASRAVGRRRRVLRGVFRAAGSVRDLHVQIDLTRSLEERSGYEVPWFREELENRERDAIESFLCRHDVMIRKLDLDRVRSTVDRALAKKSSVELASRAWQHFGTCLTTALAFDVESNDLHDLRKRVKETSNLTWILDRVFPEVALDEELKSLLDDLQNQLGKWHDFDVAVVWAGMILPDSIPQDGRENWDRYSRALRHRRGVLRSKVMRRWAKLAELQ